MALPRDGVFWQAAFSFSLLSDFCEVDGDAAGVLAAVAVAFALHAGLPQFSPANDAAPESATMERTISNVFIGVESSRHRIGFQHTTDGLFSRRERDA